MDRRTFLAAGLATAATMGAPARAETSRIKAMAFDGLALFDPRPIFALAEQFFPGKGTPLVATWRGRQFDYTWIRTLVGRYVDFLQVTDEALAFAAEAEKITMTNQQRQQLMAGFMNLKAWPDVPSILKALKRQGLGLAPLTDFTVPMLEAAIRNSDLDGIFDHLLSTDRVSAYKPDPRSYQMGLDAFGLRREQIAFVAFGGWDAAGAKTFGYPTIWINRLKYPNGTPGRASGRDRVELRRAAGVCQEVDLHNPTAARFKAPADAWIARLPQEDFCHATGNPPVLKYEKDGGPGIAQILGLLARGQAPERDSNLFALSQLMFWFLAATDGHGKNFSIFLRRDGYELTPLYDLLSAWPVIGNKARQLQPQKVKMAMAMRSGNRPYYRWREIQPRHFKALAESQADPKLWSMMLDAARSVPDPIASVGKRLPPDLKEAVWASVTKGFAGKAEEFLHATEKLRD